MNNVVKIRLFALLKVVQPQYKVRWENLLLSGVLPKIGKYEHFRRLSAKVASNRFELTQCDD